MTPGRCPTNDSFGMGEIFRLIIWLLLVTRPLGEPTRDIILEEETSCREQKTSSFSRERLSGRTECALRRRLVSKLITSF